MEKNFLRFAKIAGDTIVRPSVVYAGRTVPSTIGISVYNFEDEWL